MRIGIRGTRGSISSAGPETVRYGGDTSSVEVTSDDGYVLLLDAGSGIRPAGVDLAGVERIDILLSHLHMDHVQGLPFFAPLLDPASEVHIWGPASPGHELRSRLSRYLSPPLFPIHLRELPKVEFHDVPPGRFHIGPFQVDADLICHPGDTHGYRIVADGKTLAYLPDHEPALGNTDFPGSPEWTSGFGLADRADVLIHDSQYTDDEYVTRIGWGHTSLSHLAAFARMTSVGALVTFHHDPGHGDDQLDAIHRDLVELLSGRDVVPGTSGLSLDV